MRHRFASVRSIVDDDPVTLAQTLLLGDDSDFGHKVTQQVSVTGLGFSNPLDLSPRHQKQVDRSLRVDVSETKAVLIFINDVGGNVPIRNFLKQRPLTHPRILAHGLVFA